MTRTEKALFMMSVFSDQASKLMIFNEWRRNDPILDLRFEMARRERSA